jgi:ferredoxin
MENLMEGVVKVLVDPSLCDGNEVCVRTAPDLFALGDDDEVVRVLRQPATADELARARQAVQLCPKNALKLNGETP